MWLSEKEAEAMERELRVEYQVQDESTFIPKGAPKLDRNNSAK